MLSPTEKAAVVKKIGDDIDTTDARVGKTFTEFNGVKATVLGHRGNRFKCKREDGSSVWYTADAIDRRLGAASGAAAPGSVADIIAAHQAGATAQLSLRERAAAALADLEVMRAGFSVNDLTPGERPSILARVQAGKCEPLDPETAAKIKARLEGKEAGNSFQADVQATVMKMYRAGHRPR